MTKGKTLSSSLRHRITLQEEIRTPDEGGGYIRSWQDVAELWAEIIPYAGTGNFSRGSGKERVAGGQMQAENSYRLILRYREGVTTLMRIIFDGRVFNIRSVVNVNERNEILELWIQEGVAT